MDSNSAYGTRERKRERERERERGGEGGGGDHMQYGEYAQRRRTCLRGTQNSVSLRISSARSSVTDAVSDRSHEG